LSAQSSALNPLLSGVDPDCGDMFYLDLLRSLELHRVRYVLVGGLAMNLLGVPRLTMDVDLVLALDDANVEAFLASARELGLKPAVPVAIESLKDPAVRREWTERRNMIAFPLVTADPGAPTVDVLISHPLDFEAAYARRELRRVADVDVGVASVADMIALKQDTGRRQDHDDVEHLRRLKP
jgi:hypothetical protein